MRLAAGPQACRLRGAAGGLHEWSDRPRTWKTDGTGLPGAPDERLWEKEANSMGKAAAIS